MLSKIVDIRLYWYSYIFKGSLAGVYKTSGTSADEVLNTSRSEAGGTVCNELRTALGHFNLSPILK